MSEGTRILSNIEWKGRIRHLLILIIAILFGLIVSSVAEAQCNCKFTIPAGSAYTYFDGTAKGVLPGDVICVQGGNIGSIQFVNIRGAANNPVIIRNCGGQALIGGPTVNNGIFFNSSRYVHITGTGDSGFTYGLKIIQTSLGSQGLAYAGLSSDIEIDHMEIQKAGYAAIMAKTDPSKNCADVSAVRPNFTLYNVSIHDNYIHESGGEGIYLGDSFYTGTLVFCGSTQYCHEVRGVRIYNNRFENTGRESIQVGSGVSDVEIYNNKIYNYGAGNLNTQNGGVQLGVGTAGRLYNNFIKGGTGPAIAVQGIGGDYVYNNVIVNPGQEAITVNTRPTPLSTDIVNKGYLGGVYVVNNTIVNAASAAIIEYVNGAPGNVLYNNLIVASSTVWDKTYTTTDWKRSNNIVIPLLANAKFVNPGADDYHLSSGSLAIDAGTNVSAYGITSDADRKSRPAGASFDAGAYEFIPSQMPPIVNAGADVTLTLPSNTIM
ncbi:MAG TPA: right-handed parallel beta-helix repeat-containing protein, partial [Cyclobacteriaceae bacterium]|nr:right-handed parallel beta-helix repeat-containing protein [Cyclobacteriaceae bacterium]